MTALVHDPTVLDDPGLARDRAGGRALRRREGAPARPDPGHLDRCGGAPHRIRHAPDDRYRGVHRRLLRRLGDRYGDLLNDVRGILRAAVLRASGREIDARADEYFAVFERRRGRHRSGGGHPACARQAGLARRSRGPRPRRDPQRPPDADRCRVHRAGRPHHGARLLGGPRWADRRLRRHQGRGRAIGPGRHPLPQPRPTSPARPSGCRDALPGPGEGAARQVPQAADRRAARRLAPRSSPRRPAGLEPRAAPKSLSVSRDQSGRRRRAHGAQPPHLQGGPDQEHDEQHPGRHLQFRRVGIGHQRRSSREAGRRLGDTGNEVEEEVAE